MGIKSFFKNIYQSATKFSRKILGRNRTSTSRKVREKAKSYNISPEEYMYRTSSNGCVWGNNMSRSYILGSLLMNAVASETLGTVQQNLYNKYNQLGIPANASNADKPSMELTKKSKPVKEAKQEQKRKDDNAERALDDATRNAKANIKGATDNESAIGKTVKQDNNNANQRVENTQEDSDAANQNAQLQTTNSEQEYLIASDAARYAQQELDDADSEVTAAEKEVKSAEQPTFEQKKKLENAKAKQTAAKTQLDKAKEDEDKKKQELDKAKNNQQTVAQTGQQNVDAAKKEQKRIEEQGDIQLKDAAAATADARKTGNENISEAQNNANNVKVTGAQQVAATKNAVNTEVNAAQKQAQIDAKNETEKNLKAAADATFEKANNAGEETKVEGAEPNGKIDDQAANQETANNCWAHSGVSAMATTEEGKKMLEDGLYRDKEKGVTSVLLREAKNNGKGHNGTGVYAFTDKELAEGAKKFGTGDLDNTAYMMAAEKYLKEINEKPNDMKRENASDYNSCDRMFRMVSGQQSNHNGSRNNIGQGITWGSIENNSMYNYDTLCDGIRNGNVAGTLSFKTESGGSHLMSIAGVSENGNLLVRDPINDHNTVARCSVIDYQKGQPVYPLKDAGTKNGVHVYELPKDMYEKYAQRGSFYRFK